MLEVDEDSRLGRELIAGGIRYHAHFVPDEDLTADLYLAACERLADAGVAQYEISNFARQGFESQHNLKYWTRQPYLGFGVDAHSMLLAAVDPYVLLKAVEEKPGTSAPCDLSGADVEAVRFATSDSLEQYVAGAPLTRTVVSRRAALEEAFFLGLRLTRGVDLQHVAAEFGAESVRKFGPEIEDLVFAGLLEKCGRIVRLTPRGRLLSNEVFARFLSSERVVPAPE
jgi:oxygen-independent coproporphyrinogen-3 oxidase